MEGWRELAGCWPQNGCILLGVGVLKRGVAWSRNICACPLSPPSTLQREGDYGGSAHVEEKFSQLAACRNLEQQLTLYGECILSQCSTAC